VYIAERFEFEADGVLVPLVCSCVFSFSFRVVLRSQVVTIVHSCQINFRDGILSQIHIMRADAAGPHENGRGPPSFSGSSPRKHCISFRTM